MTATAQQYGALDTRPATPSGLDGPGMSSSAYDLAVLFRVALTKPLFVSTIATRMVPFPGYGDKPGFMLGNNDRFVPSYEGRSRRSRGSRTRRGTRWSRPRSAATVGWSLR